MEGRGETPQRSNGHPQPGVNGEPVPRFATFPSVRVSGHRRGRDGSALDRDARVGLKTNRDTHCKGLDYADDHLAEVERIFRGEVKMPDDMPLIQAMAAVVMWEVRTRRAMVSMYLGQ
jgi:hypothetical protein